MKYKPTPINILVGVVIIASILDIFFHLSPNWGVLALAHLIPVMAIGLFLDLIIQIFARKYLWTVVIESVIIIVVFILNSSLVK